MRVLDRSAAFLAAFAVLAPIAAAGLGGAHVTTFNPADDGLFGSGQGASGIEVVARTNLDRILIGGEFSTYNGEVRQRFARVMPGGELDRTYVPPAVNGRVRAIAARGDGSAILGGNFTAVGGVARGRIARMRADGTLDPAFAAGSGADGIVHAIAVQPDGRVVIGGEFTSYDGTPRARIARLLADGSLDPTFAPGAGADDDVRALAVQPDGKIVAAGDFLAFDGGARTRVVRLEPDGRVDATYLASTGPDRIVLALAAQGDGRLLVAGEFQNVAGVARGRIARLDANGFLEPTFDPGTGADGLIRTLLLQPDGRVLAGGYFNEFDGSARPGLVRLLTDGRLDATFAVGGNGASLVASLARLPGGDLLVAGGFQSYGGVDRRGLMRAQPDGAPTPDFNRVRGANLYDVAAFAPLADGGAFVAGNFTEFNAARRVRVAKIGRDGAVDPLFDPGVGPDELVYDLLPMPDGGVVIAGEFVFVAGVRRLRLARLGPDGVLDAGFDTSLGPNGRVTCLAPLPDGRFLVVGSFGLCYGFPTHGIALMYPNGALDTTFNVQFGAGPASAAHAAAWTPDGKLYVVGSFTTFEGLPRSRIARLLPDGSIDVAFDPGVGPNGPVDDVVALPDGGAILRGTFTTWNGVQRRHVARIRADGTLDMNYDARVNVTGHVHAIELQPDGKLLLGGEFLSIQGATFRGIARLDAFGTRDMSFVPGTALLDGGAVRAIRMRPDGHALVGGTFHRYSGEWRNHVALIEAWSPFATVCAGDGTAAACPCGNTGAPGRGCANSVDPTGARLEGNGTPSLSSDDLELRGSGMPSSSALYLQGSTLLNAGQGAAFGDGLRCAAGTVVRLGTRVNVAGVSAYPGPGDPSVSVRGGVAAPGTRYYQVWYRNSAAFCTSSAFNLTNAMAVEWRP